MIDTYKEGMRILTEEFSAIPPGTIKQLYRQEIDDHLPPLPRYNYTCEELKVLVRPALETAAHAVRRRLSTWQPHVPTRE